MACPGTWTCSDQYSLSRSTTPDISSQGSSTFHPRGGVAPWSISSLTFAKVLLMYSPRALSSAAVFAERSFGKCVSGAGAHCAQAGPVWPGTLCWRQTVPQQCRNCERSLGNVKNRVINHTACPLQVLLAMCSTCILWGHKRPPRHATARHRRPARRPPSRPQLEAT